MLHVSRPVELYVCSQHLVQDSDSKKDAKKEQNF